MILEHFVKGWGNYRDVVDVDEFQVAVDFENLFYAILCKHFTPRNFHMFKFWTGLTDPLN